MTDILENPENKNVEMNINSFKNANYSVSNQPISASTAFKQILKVWRKRYFSLFFGCILSLIALGFGLGLMCLAGGRIAMTALGIFAVSSILLKIMGVGRILMRYVERLYTHNAMFKALSDLRLWFFRQLAKGSASGLGFRHRGDVLSRLVSDIETLDGLYLRLLIPFIGSILTFFVFIGVVGYINPGLGLTIAALYSIGAFFLPLVTAFITREKGRSIIQGLAQLRIDIVDFLSGLREIRAFGAENRLQDTIKTKEHFLFQKQQDQAFSV
ncbi:MAG: ABC transporter transmembrane domain-containing protein, partial [Commensalibacter sp.]|nr:ABC transporter transmembrane domain-containing protein [Commensalibacter sp.]